MQHSEMIKSGILHTSNHHQKHCTRHVQSRSNFFGLLLAKPSRNGVKTMFSVECFILEGIQHIETTDPKHDHESIQDRKQIEATCHGYKCANRRQAQTYAEHEMT